MKRSLRLALAAMAVILPMLELLLVVASLATRHVDPAWLSIAGLRIAASMAHDRMQEHDTVAARLRSLTQPLVGAAFAMSPLGEGDAAGEGGSGGRHGQRDQDGDPRFRLDAFDCTTFVETSMALLDARDPSRMNASLDGIRYRGPPGFLERRHFPEAEWLPDLVHAGLLRDVTREVGGARVVRRTKHLDPQVWSTRRYAGELSLPASRIPRGDFALDVIPIDDVRRLVDRIPAGLVINVVRRDGAGVPVLIAHQGLVLAAEDPEKRVVRHAGFPPIGRVVDEPLDRFLSRMTGLRSYAVDGINLCEVLAPSHEKRVLPPDSTP